MLDSNTLMDQERQASLWRGFETLSRFPDWLADARNPELVSHSLSRLVPELISGSKRLVGCSVGHIRYKNDYWTGLYKLMVARPGDTQHRTIPLQGAIYPPGVLQGGQAKVSGSLGEEGWQVDLPELNLVLKTQEPETILASLERLTDPEQSRQFLMESIRANSPAYRDLRIETCSPKVVRYKPGSRCTVVYHLKYPDGASGSENWPDLVVAKTYRGEKGKNAYDSMAALWNSPVRSHNVVTIAEPLAYNPEMKVLIQGPIREEQTLKLLVASALQAGSTEALGELRDFMAQTARGLAEIHQSRVGLGRDWGWQDEMAEVKDRIERLSVAIPGLEPAGQPLLDRLDQIAAATTPDPLVPSHGSFRPAQVLLYKGEIGFIDFDSFCQSEPSNDLALFLSTLYSIGLGASDLEEEQEGPSALDASAREARFNLLCSIHDEFVEEYEKYAPVSRQRLALWETLEVVMFVLHGWVKIKVSEMDNIVYLLKKMLVNNRIAEPQ